MDIATLHAAYKQDRRNQGAALPRPLDHLNRKLLLRSPWLIPLKSSMYLPRIHIIISLFCFRKSTLKIIRAFLPLCSRYPCICENKACTQPGLVITHDETLTQLFFLCYKLVEIFLHLLWCFLAVEDLSD